MQKRLCDFFQRAILREYRIAWNYFFASENANKTPLAAEGKTKIAKYKDKYIFLVHTAHVCETPRVLRLNHRNDSCEIIVIPRSRFHTLEDSQELRYHLRDVKRAGEKVWLDELIFSKSLVKFFNSRIAGIPFKLIGILDDLDYILITLTGTLLNHFPNHTDQKLAHLTKSFFLVYCTLREKTDVLNINLVGIQ